MTRSTLSAAACNLEESVVSAAEGELSTADY